MIKNVCTHDGWENYQPCMHCRGIEIAGQLDEDYAQCPRCGAEWETIHSADEEVDSRGCGIAVLFCIACVAIAGVVLILRLFR